ncbi:hypothetical protein PUNSTDRAFT_137807 [Punctularia strigosozonata HHB-11173 SS5]|uniref:Uncharacterized protein n=1 Tax=Punctularia strigosozonata (strain HHB-11173) TaxID=741275 RepID=R7S4G5_PUNST|nr:uncharacterized protein PUNSTDRAFT_137807 [Punctularia strigosozonata HHB-11173 SS5]EIN05123.1 hypothetical protein PUNSTDRAFT_137807 [Punctularia strigosozonata HHB-11173 SS5]
MALVDAQTLAIHKLLTKVTVESAFSLGPPLPKLHPSPVLVAKLHLECVETYASAHELAKTPGASHKPKHPFGLGKYDADDDGACWRTSGSASTRARRRAGRGRAGEAITFLAWAKRELDELGGRGVSVGGGSREDDMRKRRRHARG